MSRKNVLKPYLVAASQSLSTSFTTNPTLILFADNIAYQVNVTTTNSTGSFAVQVSQDYQIDETTNTVINTGTWDTLTLSGSPTVSGANDVIVINLNQLPFYAIRLAYTSSVAGTGTCNIYVSHKQIGG